MEEEPLLLSPVRPEVSSNDVRHGCVSPQEESLCSKCREGLTFSTVTATLWTTNLSTKLGVASEVIGSVSEGELKTW